MHRRDFLRGLLTAAALAYVPRTTYVFLRENPLAGASLNSYDGSAFARALQCEMDIFKQDYVTYLRVLPASFPLSSRREISRA